MRTPQAIFKGRLGVALTGAAALLLASTGVVVGGGAAQAQGSGFINVMTGMQQAVEGADWLDETVTLSVGGSQVGTASVTGGHFRFDLSSTPTEGVAVTVTGDQTTYQRTVVVPDLETTRFDVPGGLVHGTGGKASAGWTDVRVELGNPWVGPTEAYGTVEEGTGAWTADVGAAAFDLRAGSLGSTVSQKDSDSDVMTYRTPMPNPIVDVKDTHSVALHGWPPGSTVRITLFNPGTNTSYPFEATVGSTGEWEGNPPPAPWDVIKPGWTASATGPVEMRETAELTKSIVVPKPYPVPEMAGFTISDTVLGTLTATTVGRGSTVNVSPTCTTALPGMPWRQAMTDGTGYFALDFSQPPEQYKGGGTCEAAPTSFGYSVSDLDGDQAQANWQVDPEPFVTADGPLWDGQQFKVVGTGFDLMMVQLQQCELLGDSAGRCDPSTELVINANPGENWPLGGAGFEIYDYTAKQYLELEGGGVVDCAAVPCAVLVVDPLRQDVGALAPLTYHQAVQLDLTASAKGTVSTVTGGATLTGSVTASEPTWVHLYGSLVQRFGRTRVVRGEFDTWVEVGDAGAATPWTVQVGPYTGQAFGSGFAEVTVSADLGDEGPSWAQTTQTVKLSATKVARR